MNGEVSGTNSRRTRTFLYSFGMTAVLVGVVNAINVISIDHAHPAYGIIGPAIDEGSSWVTILLFLWIPWLAWRAAQPFGRPRWKLLIHIPAALVFALAHVVGFVLLREFAYWSLGSHYEFGPFVPAFLYELQKDTLGYVLFVGGFTLIDHLLRQQTLVVTPGQQFTFDIRDGAKLTRVRLDEILAVSSAGNYVEFALQDGRRLLMRSPLTTLEGELSPRGFLRTHRSWLVNIYHVTALKPEGSGDYTIELGDVAVPLSRRFPEALAKLRGPTA
jgi:LytTr DNA-binding domain